MRSRPSPRLCTRPHPAPVDGFQRQVERRWALMDAVLHDDVYAVCVALADGFPRSDPVDMALPAADLLRMLTLPAGTDDPSPEDVLARALERGHPEVVDRVLRAVPHGGQPWLEVGSEDALRVLLAHGWRLDPASLHERMIRAVQAGRLGLLRVWQQEVDRTGVALDVGTVFSDALLRLVPWDRHHPDLAARLEALEFLFAHGASIEHRDRQGRTALLATLEFDQRPDRAHLSEAHRAMDDQQMRLALALLERGANAQAVGPEGSALLLAISPLGWTSGVAQALVDRGATLVNPAPTLDRPAPMNDTQDGLTRAIRSRAPGLVELCLALGEDVNRPGSLSWWGDGERARLTPLIMAVSGGFTEAIDRLVDAGADASAALNHPFWGESFEPVEPGEQTDPERDALLRRMRTHLERALLRQAANLSMGASAPRVRQRL